MSGYIGPIPVPQGIQNKETFTATAGQTTFNTNGYTDGAFISVYLNGVRLINGTDYTATNGSDIVLTQAASVSDVLDFESLNEVQLVSNTSTTPVFKTSATLKNDTHEDTDGGRESTIIFSGEQSGGEISTLAEIEASHDGAADDEKGDLIFRTNDGSDGTSPTEAMRIDSGQKVGIGTTAVDSLLHITNSDATAYSDTATDGQVGVGPTIYLENPANANTTVGGQIVFGMRSTEVQARVAATGGTSPALTFGTDDAERMRIDSSGNIGIGINAPSSMLHLFDGGTDTGITIQSKVAANATSSITLMSRKADNSNVSAVIQNDSGVVKFDQEVQTTGALKGKTLTAANSDSVVSGFSGQLLTLDGTGGSGTGDAGILFKTPSNSGGIMKDHSDGNKIRIFGGNGFPHSSDFRIDNVGNVTIGASLSKGSGSFKIRHPLESKKDTHWLVHSFVEGPQADNLYRGKVTLVDGTATQNIDTVAGMSEGTFDALNREVQCFTTNETGWTAIKGSVSGNILTITAQDNTCTDTISWMVIGERKDEHMMSKHTPWTDSDGKVILEPELTDREKEDKTEYLEGIGE